MADEVEANQYAEAAADGTVAGETAAAEEASPGVTDEAVESSRAEDETASFTEAPAGGAVPDESAEAGLSAVDAPVSAAPGMETDEVVEPADAPAIAEAPADAVAVDMEPVEASAGEALTAGVADDELVMDSAAAATEETTRAATVAEEASPDAMAVAPSLPVEEAPTPEAVPGPPVASPQAGRPEGRGDRARRQDGTEPVPVVQDTEPDFESLGLGPDALRAVRDLGFDAPTLVQQQTIGPMLEGRDVLAQAPTGTGKTAAYGLPIVERLDEDELAPQALIVAPTRELAVQVAEMLHALGKYRGMVTLPIYGGQPYDRQFRALARGVQVVTGTPGRLLDHLERGTLDLGAVRTIILDEADEMLNMGFIDDVEAILSAVPEKRQTGLFSATIPPRIARLADKYLHNPERVAVVRQEALAPRIRQLYYEVPGHRKLEALALILDYEEPESAIVFVRTRRDADQVAERLNGMGYVAQAIHGDLSQAQRERVLARFRSGHIQSLVATDVAARGLDIPDVSHVINYDLPMDAEGYVHRIGRTGRAGRAGVALTLVSPRERRQLRLIERSIHRRLHRQDLPSAADIATKRRAAFRQEVMEILDDGQLDPYLSLVEDLAGSRDPAEIAAAAFKMAANTREQRQPGRPSAFGNKQQQPAEQPPAREGFRREPFRSPAPAETSERPDSRQRRERPRTQGVEQGMARLFLRVGRQDGVRPADVVGAIANEAGLPGSAVGDIDLYDRFSFVEVPEDDVEAVLGALNSTTIKGREPRASIARQEDEPRGGDDWRPRGDQQGGASGGFDRREGGREGRFRGGAPRSGPRGPRRDRPSEDRRQPRRNRW